MNPRKISPLEKRHKYVENLSLFCNEVNAQMILYRIQCLIELFKQIATMDIVFFISTYVPTHL